MQVNVKFIQIEKPDDRDLQLGNGLSSREMMPGIDGIIIGHHRKLGHKIIRIESYVDGQQVSIFGYLKAEEAH